MTIDAQITFLPSCDLARSRAYYERILGLELVADQGACLIYRATGSAYVGVCEREHAEATDGVIVTLVTDDVDGWCDRIVASGGEIDRGPEHSDRFAIYHAFLRDPDGNVLEIQRFDDAGWASPPSGLSLGRP